MTKIFSKIISLTLIFIGAILILTLYAHQADQLGIMQHINNQNPNELTIFFTILLSIPVVIICFWAAVVQQEILLPPIRVKGTFWRIEITKWRAGFFAALLGLLILELVV